MIDQLITALNREVEMSAEEIADTLWLALHIQTSQSESGFSGFPLVKGDGSDKLDLKTSQEPKSKTSDSKKTATNQPSEEPKAGIYPRNQHKTSNLSFKAPNAPSLREPLTLARALKPLMRRVPAGTNFVLDEAATTQRIADEGLWLPVLRPTLEPWLDLELVVEESISMQIWRQTIRDLERLLKNYGIFRDVRIWGLIADELEQVQIRRGMGAAAKNQPPRSPKELIDASGRRLVLVVSDCVSSLWRDGKVTRTLELWANHVPTAIIQMLPKWLWKRTALGRTSEVRLRGLTPGVSNRKLIAKEVSLWDELEEERGVKVPVFTLETDKAATWAQMLSGQGSIWTSGVVFKSDATPVKKGNSLFNLDYGQLTAEQRVQAFRVTASPMARKLAGLLAAAPVISLPVVRLIRETLLRDALQVNVAEVFLGGLLRPLSEINTETNPNDILYDFMEGVRELLVDSVPSDYVLNVVDEVSKYVAKKVGLSLDNFAAVLRNPQEVRDSDIAKDVSYFATVTARILKRLGGKYVKLAEEIKPKKLNSVFTPIDRVFLQNQNTFFSEVLDETKKGESTLIDKNKLGLVAEAVDSLSQSKVSFGNPRESLIQLTEDTFKNSGVELNDIYKQQMRDRFDFYYMALTVDLCPERATRFWQLTCELDFSPKGNSEPIIQNLFPTQQWCSVMSFGAGMEVGLNGNLDWNVGVDSSQLTKLLRSLPNELKANVSNKDNLKAFLAVPDYRYELGHPEILTNGEGNSTCYWRIQDSELQKIGTAKLAIVFKVPKGTESVMLKGTAWAEPDLNWLTADIRDVFGALSNRLKQRLRQRNEITSQFARGDSEEWVLTLPKASETEERQPSMTKTYYTYCIRVANYNRVQVEKWDDQHRDLGQPSGVFRYQKKLEEITPLLQIARENNLNDLRKTRTLGEALFDVLFDDVLRHDFVNFYHQVVQQERKLLRVELDIDERRMPEVAALPWEFLCLPARANLGTIWMGTMPYLAFSRRRSQWIAAQPIQLDKDEKLRIALVVSAPSELPIVAYELVQEALETLANEPRNRVELLPTVNSANPEAIDTILSQEPHIFHFIGHGRLLNEGTQEVGQIALVDPDFDEAMWVDADYFSELFNRHNPGVVMLQACEGGMLSASQAFVGVASILIQLNIPVVVAMQYEVTNSTASRFARRFYQQLAADDPVDIAAQSGRRAIALGPTQYRKQDFATPVIFKRVTYANNHCIQAQLDTLTQFQLELEQGKEVADWLDRHKDRLTQTIGQQALNAYPKIRDAATAKQTRIFYLTIRQFIERLILCLQFGTNDSLEMPKTPIVLDDRFYEAAFKNLKNLLPDRLPKEGIDQLESYINYLLESLPTYQHQSFD